MSATWPKATVNYLASDGKIHTLPVDYTGLNAAAATSYLPDWDSSGNRMNTAAAAVTLINTNGTYFVPGAGTFPVLDPTQTSFSSAMNVLGRHETGHGFGLDDQHTTDVNGTQYAICGDVMSTWTASTSNPGGATNNNSGCGASTITSCDDSEVKNNPNALYQPPPPPDSPTGHHHSSGCTDSPTCSPIILDTEGEGFHLTSASEGVIFDISGTGHPTQIAWTNGRFHNAFLALPGPDGLVHNGKELFGNFTPQPPTDQPNGFIALAQFDKQENGGNGDGIIDEHDAIFAKLRLWIDENHDGVCQTNELHSLSEFGVLSISLKYFESRRVDKFGNEFRYKARVNENKPRSFRDERQHSDGPNNEIGRWTYDVFFVTK